MTDPITLEIIRHELLAIPNQIEKNIERTAFSPLVQEYKDYAVGLVDPEGALICQSRGSLPIFVANALGTAVRAGLAIYGAEGIADGDAVLCNEAASLGQHLNNVVLYTPVREGRTLVGFFAVLVHWMDLGGMAVGSSAVTTSTDIWQEGIQYPTVKLLNRGERNAELLRIITANTRFPRLVLGDLEAQIAGCLLGRDMVTEVLRRRGAPAVDAAIHAMRRQADAAAAAVIGAIPPGAYHANAFLDDDGIRLGETIPVRVTVRADGERLVVDLSGLGPQMQGPSNAGRNGGAVAAARIAAKYLLTPTEPVNQGDFDRLVVEAPEGTFLTARPEAPIAGSGNTIPTVVDTILRAFGEAMPARARAAHHGTYGVHSMAGRLPRSGELFYNLDTATGGWGATAEEDGAFPLRSNAHGDVPDIPAEMQEALYPYRLRARRLRPDSGGAGRRRGGLGVVKEYDVTHPCRLNLKFERGQCPPWGLAGGGDGATCFVEIERATGGVTRALKGSFDLVPGDRVTIASGGGGGHGRAWERETDRVLADLAAGYVTPAHAAEAYGVLLDAAGMLDAAATEARRAALRRGETV